LKAYTRSDTLQNKFIDLTLAWTLRVIASRIALPRFKAPSLHITIQADNDFYSQQSSLAARGLETTRESLRLLPRFCPTETSLQEVHKTGLGSSAALVTSLVASLLVHFGVADLDVGVDRVLVHNLAQFCHCLAQGKIGSGFDVSSAVFGSHYYTRFSPDILAPALDVL
jgi:phosphomevalonate kinase